MGPIMSAVTNPAAFLFKLIGPIGKRCPHRLIFDAFEVRWEALPSDEADPAQVKKRKVRTLSAHVDIHISEVISGAFDDFIDQETIEDPGIIFHRMNGAEQFITYAGEWDVLRISAQRSAANLARVNLSLQRRTAPADADETSA